MKSYFKIQKLSWLLILALMTTSLSVAQRNVEKWKLQFALGVNNTLDQPKTPGYYSKQINFPTINLGVQHMFANNWGAKLDLGFNRSSEADSSLPYKLNYTRINAQLVYDFKDVFKFLPRPIGIVAHFGPGVSMTRPLGSDKNNTYNFLNVMGGFELHYRLSKSLSIYGDAAYVYSLSDKTTYMGQGYSFDGDIVYVAIGVAISLSGCNYCGY